MKSRLLRLSTIIAAVLTSAAAWAQPTVSISVPGNAITADSGSVAINLAALGNENTVSFTLTWDPAVLTYVSSALGASVPTDGSATLTRNSTQTATGKLGVLLGLESGTSYTAGAKHILTVNFTRASQVASTTIAFVDTPTARRVIDKDAVAITAAVFVDATISTAPPTAPTITTQPQNQTVVAGAMAMFSVVATGNPTPTSFVWKKASTTLADGTAASGAVISGATTAMIHLAGVAAADAGSYTVTVGNGVSPDVTSSAATLTINPALSTTLAVASKALTIGVAAVAFTPVTAADGTPAYTYAVSPALPAGLTLSTSTGALSGTPTAATTAADYTVTVTDSATATSSKTFSLTVNPAVVATQAVATTTVNAGQAITPFTPVTAAGGTAPLAFSVAPALPGDLAISASTGAISGTATAASGPTTYTVTATDSVGALASATFSLTVNGPFTTAVAMASATTTFNTLATDFIPVTAAGGTAPYTFAVTPALPGGLSLNANTGAISGTPTAAAAAATFTITATDSVNATSSKTFSLVVEKAPQTITFGALATKTFGDADFNVTATASSGLPVTFASATPTVATVTPIGGVVLVGGGTTVITASQSGSDNYLAAPGFPQTLTVNKAAATVVLDTPTLSQTYTGAGRVVTATTTPPSLPLLFTYNGNATAPTDAGSYTVVATIDDPRYQGTVNGTLVVAKAAQTIAFAALPSKALDDPLALVVIATASSTLPVSFASSDTNVATINATTGAVTLVNTGTTNITASIGESTNYLAATDVVQPLVVLPNLQTIDFAPLAPRTYAANDTFTMSATAKGRTGNNTGLSVGFASSNTTVATVGATTLTDGVSSATVTVLAAGTTNITASQAGNANFAAAANVVNPLAIAPATVTVTLGNLAATYDGTPRAATATTADPAGLNIVFAYGAAPGSPTPPTNAGTYPVTATIQENNYTGTATGNLVIAKADQSITFPAVGSPKLINAAPFTMAATASSNLTVTYTSSSPAVAAVTGNTGTIIGLGTTTLTAQQAGNENYNAAPDATQPLTVNPVAPQIVGAPANVPAAIKGSSFLYGPVSLNALSAPATFSATGLPAGLSVNPNTGNIGGIPTEEGTFNVTLTVTNATASDSKAIVIVVQPPAPAITSAAAASAVAGTAFTYTATAIPATGVTFAATGVPAWLSFDVGTGVLTGTPTTAGIVTVTITASNTTGSATLPLVINVTLPANAPAYVGPTNPSGTAGTAFTFTPNFGTGTTVYAIAGTLPTGLSFSTSTGTISGTTLNAGTFPVTVSATRAGLTATQNLNLVINPSATAPVVAVTGGNVRSATVGTAFGPIALTANPAATSFTIGTLPAGLTVGGTAEAPTISGTPTTPGTTTVALTATNSAGTGPVTTLVITVNPHAQAPIITSSPVITARVGVLMTPYTFAATPTESTSYATTGTLPAGLTLDGTAGTITGTPAAGTMGTHRVMVVGTNGNGSGLGLELTINIAPPLTVPVINSNGTAAAQVGQAFNYQIAATNTPTSYNATPLPAGLAINTATGIISGVPTTATGATPFEVTLTATNVDGNSNPKTLAITIVPAPATPVITSAGSAAGRVGTAFSYQITASESPSSYVAMDLPPGLAVNPGTGAIAGTPAVSGTFAASIRAANAAGLGAASALTINVSPAPTAPAISSAAGAVGQVGTLFTYQIVAAPGPITSYAYSGTLPGGLGFNSASGAISGSPTVPGTFRLSLSASSAGGTSIPQELLLLINPAANVPLITSPSVAIGNVGVGLNYQITASNPPLITLDAVNLPAGLAVNPFTGLIEGTPTAVGTTVASLVGTNAAGTGPARDLTIVVQPALTAPAVTGASQVSARVGVNFNYQITATGNPTAFEVVGAPAWMTLNTSTGALAGSPVAPGQLHVFLLASNSAGVSGPKLFTISIAPAANTPVITSTRTAAGVVGTQFAGYTITATPAATAFVATGLPPGLSLNGATGAITGTPSSSGVFTVQVSARNANGVGAPTFVVFTIAANIVFGN